MYAELLFEDSCERVDLSERGNVDGMYNTLRYESAERESSKIVGALLAKCSYLQYKFHFQFIYNKQHPKSVLLLSIDIIIQINSSAYIVHQNCIRVACQMVSCSETQLA